MWMWLAFALWVGLTIVLFAWLLPSLWIPASADQTFGIYAYLKDWQTGLGAILGFIGLMFIEIVRRMVERNDRRKTVRSAFDAEIGKMKATLGNALRNLEPALAGAPEQALDFSPAQITTFKAEQPVVLQGFAADLGLLPRPAQAAVLGFYTEHRRASTDMAALVTSLQQTETMDPVFVRTIAGLAGESLREAMTRAEDALSRLGHSGSVGRALQETRPPDHSQGKLSPFACRWTGQSLEGCRKERHGV